MRSTLAVLKYGSTSQYVGSTLAHLTSAAVTRAQALAAMSQAEGSATAQARPPVLPKPRLPRPPLTSRPAPGGGARGGFTLPCRKVLIHFCPEQASSAGVRTFLEKNVKDWAERFPTVEWVVSPRKARHPVLIAEYTNGRSKEICVRNREPSGVASKLQLLLDASGRKVVALKRRPVESANESARGIWSPLHTAEGRKAL
ncbi:39S ribosomal protein L51, mitochondrial [Tilletia horrida]|uniref:Large ribosomal subunit protein mL43 n=1 Tax=Tilletia horrida TaxID=155126 RepID=A0AAN6GDK5_9BASI|nr:39S ribosomal protein L51, mitochondrial [Tilletia horrida]